jgi:hypothetical protein
MVRKCQLTPSIEVATSLENRADRSTGRSLPLQGRGSGFKGAKPVLGPAYLDFPVSPSKKSEPREAKYIKTWFISYCYDYEAYWASLTCDPGDMGLRSLNRAILGCSESAKSRGRGMVAAR